MTTIKVWVGDLERYNSGELVGEWVTLPMEMDEIMETCAIKCEEWYIGDTDSEIDVNGLSLSQMNELAEKLDSIDEWEKENLMAVINSGHFSGYGWLEDAIKCFEDGGYMVYGNCKDMSDVAYEYLESNGGLEGMPKHLVNYFDYDSYGRDMEIQGYFYKLDYETYIEIWN